MKYRNIGKKMIDAIVNDLSNVACTVTYGIINKLLDGCSIKTASIIKHNLDTKNIDLFLEFVREFERCINKRIYNENLLFNDVKEIVEELKNRQE